VVRAIDARSGRAVPDTRPPDWPRRARRV